MNQTPHDALLLAVVFMISGLLGIILMLLQFDSKIIKINYLASLSGFIPWCKK